MFSECIFWKHCQHGLTKEKRKRQNMEREKGYNYSIPEDPGNLLVLSQSFMAI